MGNGAALCVSARAHPRLYSPPQGQAPARVRARQTRVSAPQPDATDCLGDVAQALVPNAACFLRTDTGGRHGQRAQIVNSTAQIAGWDGNRKSPEAAGETIFAYAKRFRTRELK